MIWRLLRADLRRGRAVALTLTLLISVSTLLGAASASMVVRTYLALNAFWAQAQPADLVQMHAGELDAGAIGAWASTNPDVVAHQVLQTLPVPGNALLIAGRTQADSVLEPALVTSPERFDLLVDADGHRVDPRPGEVWLPVHYQANRLAAVGDMVTIVLGEQTLNLRVVGFARDAQMNPSMVTSKRLVVHADDHAIAAAYLEPEYLVEFDVADGSSVKAVQDAYAAAGLPAQGIVADASIFKLLNALSVLVLAATMILISAILVAVALLALRFASLTTMEQDVAEIATLKAIGLPLRRLKGLYLTKYAALAIVGSAVGLLLSVPVTHLTSTQITQYLGRGTAHPILWIAPLLAAVLMVAIISGSCWQFLGRIGRMPTVQALRTGSLAKASRPRLRLSRSRLGVHVFLGIRGALRPANALLLLVIALCTFVMVVPANVAATFDDPRFSTYLGVGQADVRIDVRDFVTEPAALARSLDGDNRVVRQTTLLSGRFEVKALDGSWESLVIETGDHEMFPLRYQSGHAPRGETEIALSVNEAEALAVVLGQQVELKVGTELHSLHITGIYQDITNGGKTGKARFSLPGRPLWQVIYVETRDDADTESLVAQFKQQHPSVKVTNAAHYAAETMGGTTAQMRLIGVVAGVAGVGLVLLIVTLFGILVVVRDRHHIATLKALGCTLRQLHGQYAVQFALVAGLGIGVGILLAMTLGQTLFRVVMGSMGAPGVTFMPNPWISWWILPLLVAAGCTVAVSLALRGVGTISIDEQE